MDIKRDYMNAAFDEYRKNLIENYHVSEEELGDFDQFMSIMRGDIIAPVYCNMNLEIRERKRIYEQFIRSFEEG